MLSVAEMDEPRAEAADQSVICAEVRPDKPGIDGIHGHSSITQPSSKLIRVQKICKLRASIYVIATIASGMQVRWIASSSLMCNGRYIDNAGGNTRLQCIEQEARKQKVREMIECKCHFNTISARLPTEKHGTRVIHQDIESVVALLDIFGELANVALRGQVGSNPVHTLVLCRRDDALAGVRTPPRIPSDDDDGSTSRRQLTGCYKAQSGRAPVTRQTLPPMLSALASGKRPIGVVTATPCHIAHHTAEWDASRLALAASLWRLMIAYGSHCYHLSVRSVGACVEARWSTTLRSRGESQTAMIDKSPACPGTTRS